MKVVTNTRVSDSRIKIRPKVFNSELDYKLPKYTGLGLTFKGDVKVNGSVASGFSKDSYIDTGINLGDLNTNHTYTFRVKFKQNTYDSYFVNTMGSSNNRINGVWGNGTLEIATSRNIYDMQNTKVNISEFVDQWLIAETIWNRGTKEITYIYYNEDNVELGRVTGTLNSNFASENLLIGIGLHGYPAYNLEIDLLDTYVLRNGMNVSPWVENVGGRSYTVQRYYHNQIGTADGNGYRMFTGFILILCDDVEQLELRPKNDPQLWQRDGNFVKTVFTTDSNDWLRGNLSTSNKGANCVDNYKLQNGEYIVKYNFNGNYDTCWYSRNGYYLQYIFCPTGSTYDSAGGNNWNQKSDCSVDIYIYDCPRLYAFAFNNFGGYGNITNKYSPNTREYYELEGVVLMDKTVGRGRAQYKEIVYNL